MKTEYSPGKMIFAGSVHISHKGEVYQCSVGMHLPESSHCISSYT